MKRILTTLAVLLLLVSCGSDDPTGPGGGNSNPTAISGTVIKGPVSSSAVSLRAINNDGSPGATVAGPFMTDASGAWSGELAAGTRGPFYLVATGGTYDDEVSGVNVDLGTGTLMGYSAAGSGVVSPFTQMLCAVVAEADASLTVGEAWQGAIAAFMPQFGFDPTTTEPSSTGTTAQKSYVASLGGLSLLVDEELSGLVGVTLFELALALIADIADGVLDGTDVTGGTITVGDTTVELPDIDLSGLGEFVNACNQYAAGDPDLADLLFGPIVLDWGDIFNPNPTGESVILSGPALGILPQNTFTVFTSSTSGTVSSWSALTTGLGAYALTVSDTVLPGQTIRIAAFAYSDGVNTYGWGTSSGVVPGLTIDGNVFEFKDVTLTSQDGQGDLIINGDLTGASPLGTSVANN